MSVETKWGSRWAIGLAAVAMVTAACSSGDDALSATPVSPTVASTGQTSGSSDAAPADVDCQMLGGHRVALQSHASQMSVVKSAEVFDIAVGTKGLDEMEAAIEAFRPHQDIDTAFGPVKEGLDNLSTDITAVRAGEFEFGAPSGPYGQAGFSALMEELGC